MPLKEKLEKLHNKSWMFRTTIHKVYQTRINEDSFEVVTDRGFLKFPIDKAESVVEEFLPVEEKGLIKIGSDLPVKGLTTTLQNVIKNLEEEEEIDAKVLKKYDQINKTVKNMIDLGKLQLDITKAMRNT